MKTTFIVFIEMNWNFLFGIIIWISTIDSLLNGSKLKTFETNEKKNTMMSLYSNSQVYAFWINLTYMKEFNNVNDFKTKDSV